MEGGRPVRRLQLGRAREDPWPKVVRRTDLGCTSVRSPETFTVPLWSYGSRALGRNGGYDSRSPRARRRYGVEWREGTRYPSGPSGPGPSWSPLRGERHLDFQIIGQVCVGWTRHPFHDKCPTPVS